MVALAAVSVPSGAAAKQAVRADAALVHAEGAVDLNDRAVEPTSTPAVLPDQAGLRTTGGRAAVALKRGGWLFLDVGTSVRVLGNSAYDFNRIEVLTGSIVVASGSNSALVDCESEIRLSDGGTFRFDVQRMGDNDERSCRFRVFEGAAAVPLVTVTNALRAGQTMICNRRCGDMIPTNEFSRVQLDVFDHWARQLVERLTK
jgi:hypothetical protein